MNKMSDEETDTEEIAVKLGKLEEEIRKFRKKRDKYNQLTKESLTKRNEINQEINSFLDKAKDYMKKRDNLNKFVKELKDKRKKLQSKIQENKKVLEEVVEKEKSLNHSNIRKKRNKMSRLSKKIDSLEWDLQTSVLKPEEEKEMIQLLENLSNQLNTIAEEVHITAQQTKMWKEISTCQKEINSYHTQIINSAKESQIYHNLMNKNFQKVNSLRKEANEHHKQFLKNKKTADLHHKKFLGKVSEKNEARNQLKEFQEKIRRDMEEKRRINLEENTEKALEKYENGDNLSLDEFRLLVEKGMI